jgi:hypothetical protein
MKCCSGRDAVASLAAAAGLAGGAYATMAAFAWLAYGRPASPTPAEADALLTEFIPDYEIVERHHVRVAAPADVVLRAAREQRLLEMPLVRAMVRARELALGAEPDHTPRPEALLAQTLALGWGLLAEVPGREIVVGAVTKPWEAQVTFHALPPETFAAFKAPGYVKIVWTLRADPEGDSASMFRTETRALATDPVARRRFRRYWAAVSPGVWLIRRLSLNPLRKAAESQVRAPGALSPA